MVRYSFTTGSGDLCVTGSFSMSNPMVLSCKLDCHFFALGTLLVNTNGLSLLTLRFFLLSLVLFPLFLMQLHCISGWFLLHDHYIPDYFFSENNLFEGLAVGLGSNERWEKKDQPHNNLLCPYIFSHSVLLLPWHTFSLLQEKGSVNFKFKFTFKFWHAWGFQFPLVKISLDG